jgi:hypothetical protein
MKQASETTTRPQTDVGNVGAMARPNRDRVRIGIWLARNGHEAVRAEALQRGVPVNQVYRDVFRLGWRQYHEQRNAAARTR